MGEKWVQEFLGLCFFFNTGRNFWTLFIFEPFLPHVWDSVFFKPLKMKSSLYTPSWYFQHHGSGNSFRGAKGSLYWSCPIQIPSKCWGWSNLIFLTRCPLSQACPGFKRGASEEPTHFPVPEIPAAGLHFFQPSDTIFLQSREDMVRSQLTSLSLASLLLDSAFCQGWKKNGVHEYNFCNKNVSPLDLS